MGELREKTKGKIMQAVGALTNDKEMKREGQVEEFKGKVEAKVADIKQAAEHIKDAVKKAVK